MRLKRKAKSKKSVSKPQRPAIERDDQHRYWCLTPQGREEYLGVTRCLVESNIVDDSYFTDIARGRGKIVHFFAEHIVMNRPLLYEIHDGVVGYITALRHFLDRLGPEILDAETIMASDLRKLAGQRDIRLKMQGATGTLEIKTGAYAKWHPLQTAAYAYLERGPQWLSEARWSLHLTASGGFSLKEHTDHTDLDYFFRTYELLQWRIRHGTWERPYGRRGASYGEREHSGRADVDFTNGFGIGSDADPSDTGW